MQQKHIFILGHMRSYSTLLSHILGSNEDISGYTELHQSYQFLTDFNIMRQKICASYEEDINGYFLLDKILHNEYKINKDTLNSKNSSIIFLIRKPEDSILSIIDNAYKLNMNERQKNPYVATAYYIKRLKELHNYAEQLEVPYLFIESENIINNPELIFKQIEGFLNLRKKLNSKYSNFKLTGKRYYGDSSNEIFNENIIQTKKVKSFILEPQLLSDAQMAYDICKTHMHKHSLAYQYKG